MPCSMGKHTKPQALSSPVAMPHSAKKQQCIPAAQAVLCSNDQLPPVWVDKFPPSNCSEVLGSGVEALHLPSTSWKEKVSCWSVSLSLYWCCQLPCAKQDLPTLLWRGNASSCLEQSLNSKASEILFTSQMSFKHWHRLKRRLSTEIHAGICILWARFQARSRSDWEQHECRPQTYPGLRLVDPRSGSTFLCHSNT